MMFRVNIPVGIPDACASSISSCLVSGSSITPIPVFGLIIGGRPSRFLVFLLLMLEDCITVNL